MAAKPARAGDDLEALHEINVTPFIDVCLVLLIVFMVAAPLATADVAVDLPTASAPPLARPDKPIVVTLKPDLSLALGEQPLAPEALGAALDGASAGQRERRVFLQADKRVPYGDVMALMNRLREAGYLRVALVGLDGGAGR